MKTFTQFIDEGKKKGLWDNIHAKRKRGEKPAKPGDKDYPKTLNVDEGAAWTKKSGKNEKGGLNEKGRKSYERENPGSDLKAPSKKVGNPRRKSFCARMKGMRKRQKPSNNTGDDRLSKSLRAWNCGYEPEGNSILESLKDELLGNARKKHADAEKKKFKDFRAKAKEVKKKGIQFFDKKGTGRIIDGKKVYKR